MEEDKWDPNSDTFKLDEAKRTLKKIEIYKEALKNNSQNKTIFLNVITFGGANRLIFKDGSTFGWILKGLCFWWVIWLTSFFTIPKRIQNLVSRENDFITEKKSILEKIENKKSKQTEFEALEEEAIKKIKAWDVEPLSKEELNSYGIFSTEEVFIITEAYPVKTYSRMGWVSGSSGINYKLTNKTRIRLGGSKGQLTSSEYKKNGETGYMYLTPKSIRFAGVESIDCPLNKISRIDVNDTGALVISRTDKVNSIELYVGQYNTLWIVFITTAINKFVK